MSEVNQPATLPALNTPSAARMSWGRAALDAVLWWTGGLFVGTILAMLPDAFSYAVGEILEVVSAVVIVVGALVAVACAGMLRRSWRPVVMILVFGLLVAVVGLFMLDNMMVWPHV